MSDSQIFVFNGELVEFPQIVEDRGFAFGDGVFETIAFHNSNLPLLNLHLARLTSSCVKLKININLELLTQYIEKLIQIIAAKYQLGRLKVIVSRGSKGAGCYPAADDIANVSLIFTPTYKVLRSAVDSVELLVANTPLYDVPVLAGLKHLNRLNYVMAAVEENIGPDEELLFTDVRDDVVETMHANVFFIRHSDKVLLTPALEHVGVNGVLRRLVIEQLAAKCDLEVCEQNISILTIDEFDEIFICNAIKGIVPVTKITYGDKKTVFQNHTKSLQLHNIFQEYLVGVA